MVVIDYLTLLNKLAYVHSSIDVSITFTMKLSFEIINEDREYFKFPQCSKFKIAWFVTFKCTKHCSILGQ